MTLEISMDGSAWDEILSSLHKVANGEEEIPMDVNIVASPDDRVQIYVRKYQTLQVLHELIDTGLVSVTVSEPTEIVFNSEILRSVIQQAKTRDITLRFHEHTFSVEVEDMGFSTPTTLDLRLVQESQFQSPVSIDGAMMIGTVKRGPLLENLNMFETISKVASFSVEDGFLEISVSDKVQGSGTVKEDVSDECEIDSIEAEYRIRPLKDFLNQMEAEQVKIQMNPSATLKLRSSSAGRTSEMLLSKRIDDF